MESKIEEFYFKKEEPNKSIFFALRDIFLGWDEEVHTCLKYGLPCFTYRNKILCYHWQDKKTNIPYVLFNYGKFIEHDLLETKDRKLMKSMDIHPDQDIPIEALNAVFQQAKKHIDSIVKG